MTTFIALLRAVNVGGTGKLPMARLRALCADAGYANVRTYLASGNVIFDTSDTAASVKATLEAALEALVGKPVSVILRSGAQMAAVLVENPFSNAPPDRTIAIFLDAPPPTTWREGISGRHDEHIAASLCEIYVHYPNGIGASKLRIRAAAAGTGRNMNTVANLAALASPAPGDEARSL
ncbi:MAG: DUF1697 domain-containing protein [Hyphomicrobiales bacterium]|nr:DUF1697 domain-containing protein [Hyphomicrobiales bacterium]